jgi:hypothetical protein
VTSTARSSTEVDGSLAPVRLTTMAAVNTPTPPPTIRELDARQREREQVERRALPEREAFGLACCDALMDIFGLHRVE